MVDVPPNQTKPNQTIKWFQVQFYLANRWTLKVTTTPENSEPGSYGNEKVIYTPQTPRLDPQPQIS